MLLGKDASYYLIDAWHFERCRTHSINGFALGSPITKQDAGTRRRIAQEGAQRDLHAAQQRSVAQRDAINWNRARIRRRAEVSRINSEDYERQVVPMHKKRAHQKPLVRQNRFVASVLTFELGNVGPQAWSRWWSCYIFRPFMMPLSKRKGRFLYFCHTESHYVPCIIALDKECFLPLRSKIVKRTSRDFTLTSFNRLL